MASRVDEPGLEGLEHRALDAEASDGDVLKLVLEQEVEDLLEVGEWDRRFG